MHPESAALRDEVSRQTLSTEELSKIPGTFGDPLRAIENLPGAARPPFNTGLFIIEGARPTDSRVYMQAAEVPQLYHYGGLTSVVPAGFIDRLEYLPHNFGVRYGRATAGTIDVELRAGKRDRWHGAVDVNVLHIGVEAEGPLVRGGTSKEGDARVGTLLLGVRRSYIDAGLAFINAIGEGPPGLKFVNAPVYWDYQAVLNQPLGGGVLRISLTGADDQIRLRFAGPQDFDPSVNGQFSTHILFHRLLARYTRRLDRWDLLVQDTTGYTTTDLSLGRTVSLLVRTVSSDVRLEARRAFTDASGAEKLRLLFGADLQFAYLWLDAAVPAPVREGEFQRPPGTLSQVRVNDEGLIANPGLYAELSAQPHPGLTITPGLRFDYWSYIRRYTLDPRLSVRAYLSRLTQVKVAAGLYAQDPQPQDYFSDFGNAELRPERALHVSFAVEQALYHGLFLEVTGIYKHLFDFAATSTYKRRFGSGPDPEELHSERTASTASGRIYGATFLLRQSVSKHLFGWISYSLLRSERRDCDTCSPRLFDFDQTHVLIAAVHTYLPYRIEVGLRFRYITGVPVTLAKGGIFDSDLDQYQPVLPTVAERDAQNERLADFHQLDLRIERAFVFKRWSFRLYLDISNLYNRRAAEQVIYSYDYSKRAVLTGLPILPSLGVRVEL